MWGVIPRPDWMDAGDYTGEVKFWTDDERAARALVRVFYHGMAEVVYANKTTE